jgi:hypothetical protein
MACKGFGGVGLLLVGEQAAQEAVEAPVEACDANLVVVALLPERWRRPLRQACSILELEDSPFAQRTR